ncbi:MAG TPA: FkbM family methyltransferase [Pyrinomonadaceae bacterium]|nr:FkbM family methyltransferase [Pyrinomonadaceae bacterium]
MHPTQSSLTQGLKRLLFRPVIKHPKLQRLWSRLHTVAVFAMNYGGGGLIETSGETWVLSTIVPNISSDAPVVFDVGANVGDYSLLVKRFMPSAQVHAFEPANATYQQLVAHLKGSQGIKPYNIGFSDSEKTVELFSYEIQGQQASLLASIDQRLPTQVVQVSRSASEQITVKTIDAFCKENAIDRIDFLKLDVEGHELAVLRGARNMLEEGSIAIIQFEFGPANIYSRTYFFDFWTLLSGAYDIFRIVPAGIAPIAYYSEHREIFLTTNYLAIKKPAD